MMYGHLTGHGSGPGYGPFDLRYHGVYKSPSGGWTGNSSDNPFSISPGSMYDDTVLLIGGFGDSGASELTSVAANGKSGIRLAETANIFWWAFDGISGSNITISGTSIGGGLHYSLYCFTVSGATLGTNFSDIVSDVGYVNNSNSASASIAGGLIGDVYVAVGTKQGTGASNNWGNPGLSGGPGMTILDDSRIGTSGSGAGGVGYSAFQTINGTQTISTAGSDSTKAIGIAALRLRRRA